MTKILLTTAQLTGNDDSHITWLDQSTGIHHEALSAWQALSIEAKKAGFELKIASGYRNFSRQLSIWNRKFSGSLAIKNDKNETLEITRMTEQEIVHAILHFSALPGTSRHHWGSDIDIYATNLLPTNQQLQLEPWEYMKSGYFYPLSQWLAINACRFGFYFPYDKYRNGVAAEPWHLSYWPIAQQGETLLTEECIHLAILKSEIFGKKAITQKLTTIYQNYIKNVGSIDYG